MKIQVELIYLSLLLLSLLLKSSAVQNFQRSLLGRLVLVVGVVALALKNKTYGMVAAFLTVCLMQNVREGMAHGAESEDAESEEAESEEDESEDAKPEEAESDEAESDEAEPEEDESEEDETSDKEGFTLFKQPSAHHTSSMDRLAADEMLKSKPANTFPVDQKHARGQEKSVVSSVFDSVRKLF